MKRPSGFIALLLLSVLLSTLPPREAALAADPLTVVAVGDIMMGTDWPEDLLPPRDGAGIFDNVLDPTGEGEGQGEHLPAHPPRRQPGPHLAVPP
jgi:hypothetical protein